MKAKYEEIAEILYEKWLLPGAIIREVYGSAPNYSSGRLIHIRSIVDDHYIVFKTWFRHKQRWSYQVESIWYFIYRFPNGVKLIKKGGRNEEEKKN